MNSFCGILTRKPPKYAHNYIPPFKRDPSHVLPNQQWKASMKKNYFQLSNRLQSRHKERGRSYMSYPSPHLPPTHIFSSTYGL